MLLWAVLGAGLVCGARGRHPGTMTAELVILGLVVVTALAFDFTNGFHDTGNAMATSIATGALKPRTAVALSAVLNLVGAFLSVEVATTVTRDVLLIQTKDGGLVSGLDPTIALTLIFSGLIGGILWNLATWLFGLPSSSSHAVSPEPREVSGESLAACSRVVQGNHVTEICRDLFGDLSVEFFQRSQGRFRELNHPGQGSSLPRQGCRCVPAQIGRSGRSRGSRIPVPDG